MTTRTGSKDSGESEIGGVVFCLRLPQLDAQTRVHRYIAQHKHKQIDQHRECGIHNIDPRMRSSMCGWAHNLMEEGRTVEHTLHRVTIVTTHKLTHN